MFFPPHPSLFWLSVCVCCMGCSYVGVCVFRPSSLRPGKQTYRNRMLSTESRWPGWRRGWVLHRDPHLRNCQCLDTQAALTCGPDHICQYLPVLPHWSQFSTRDGVRNLFLMTGPLCTLNANTTDKNNCFPLCTIRTIRLKKEKHSKRTNSIWQHWPQGYNIAGRSNE